MELRRVHAGAQGCTRVGRGWGAGWGGKTCWRESRCGQAGLQGVVEAGARGTEWARGFSAERQTESAHACIVGERRASHVPLFAHGRSLLHWPSAMPGSSKAHASSTNTRASATGRVGIGRVSNAARRGESSLRERNLQAQHQHTRVHCCNTCDGLMTGTRGRLDREGAFLGGAAENSSGPARPERFTSASGSASSQKRLAAPKRE